MLAKGKGEPLYPLVKNITKHHSVSERSVYRLLEEAENHGIIRTQEVKKAWKFAIIQDAHTQNLFDEHFELLKKNGKTQNENVDRIIREILHADTLSRKRKPYKPLSKSALVRCKTFLGVGTIKKPNKKTEKRLQECMDVRNAMSEIFCATHCIQPYANMPTYSVSPSCIWNPDGVGIQINEDTEPILYRLSKDDPKDMYSSTGKAKPFFLHLYLNLSPGGYHSTPVIAIADSSLDDPSKIGILKIRVEGSCEIWMIRSLHGKDNQVFHQEYFSCIILPELKKRLEGVRRSSRFSSKDPRSALVERAVLSIDGEREQYAVIDDEENRSKLVALRVAAWKHPSGCSCPYQGNDYGPAHLTLKKAVQSGKYTKNLDSCKKHFLHLLFLTFCRYTHIL